MSADHGSIGSFFSTIGSSVSPSLEKASNRVSQLFNRSVKQDPEKTQPFVASRQNIKDASKSNPTFSRRLSRSLSDFKTALPSPSLPSLGLSSTTVRNLRKTQRLFSDILDESSKAINQTSKATSKAINRLSTGSTTFLENKLASQSQKKQRPVSASPALSTTTTSSSIPKTSSNIKLPEKGYTIEQTIPKKDLQLLGKGANQNVYQVTIEGKEWVVKALTIKVDANNEGPTNEYAATLGITPDDPKIAERERTFYRLNHYINGDQQGEKGANVALKVYTGTMRDPITEKKVPCAIMEKAEGAPPTGKAIECRVSVDQQTQKQLVTASENFTKDTEGHAKFWSYLQAKLPHLDEKQLLFGELLHLHTEWEAMHTKGEIDQEFHHYATERSFAGAEYNPGTKETRTKPSTPPSFTFKVNQLPNNVNWEDPKLQTACEELQLMKFITSSKDPNITNNHIQYNADNTFNSLKGFDNPESQYQDFAAIDKVVRRQTRFLEKNEKAAVDAILAKPFNQRAPEEVALYKRHFVEGELGDPRGMKLPLELTEENYKKFSKPFNEKTIKTLFKEENLSEAAAFGTLTKWEAVQEHLKKMEPLEENGRTVYRLPNHDASKVNGTNSLLKNFQENVEFQRTNNSIRLTESNEPYRVERGPPELKANQ